MNPGVYRTPRLLERLFPSVIWGHPDKQNGPLILTFDDGPDPDATPAVLDILETYGISALFFVQGNRVKGSEKLLEEMTTRGHGIGYHGLTHQTWWFRGARNRHYQMDPSFIPDMTQLPFTTPLLLRPPYGRLGPLVVRSAREMNALLLEFTLVVGDWLEGKTRDILIEDLYTLATPGDIVVLHDGSRNGAILSDVLQTTIPRWQDKGLSVGSWRELQLGLDE